MKKIFCTCIISLISVTAFADIDISSFIEKINSATTAEDAIAAFNEGADHIKNTKKLNNSEQQKIQKAAKEISNKAEKETQTQDSNKKDSEDKSENKSKPEKKLSDADQQKKIDELRDNADAMHERENSTANKMLGGAAMATMGISGMELASAMSEKKAMADAELDMTAYLATFVCDYGAGHNIKGGEVDVELPSSPELSTIKAEYIALATDLKERKAALGMQPGIESELILDAATTGLYDNESLGKTDGVYTSVSRALLDENSADAAEWNAEKERLDKKIKNSATALAVGAVASIAGNAIINAKAPKEQSDKINKKYEKLKQAAKEIDELPNKKCSEFKGTNGNGTSPNCTCENIDERFFAEKGCVACNNGEVYNEHNECVVEPDETGCELDGDVVDRSECKCVTNATESQNTCECKDGYKPVNGQCILDCELSGLTKTDTCACVDHATENDQNQCVCDDGYNDTPTPGQCTKITAQAPKTIKLPTDKTFASGSADFNDDANEIITEITKKMGGDPDKDNTCIKIVGHSDRVQLGKITQQKFTDNEGLSLARANSVKEIFTNNGWPTNSITIEGKGDTECTKEKYPKNNAPACRRVEITIESGACTAQ